MIARTCVFSVAIAFVGSMAFSENRTPPIELGGVPGRQIALGAFEQGAPDVQLGFADAKPTPSSEIVSPAAGSVAAEVVNPLFQLTSLTAKLESAGPCTPGSVYVVTSFWKNASQQFVYDMTVEPAPGSPSGGNTLIEKVLEVPDKAVQPGQSVVGTFRIQLAACRSFQFFVDLRGVTGSAKLVWVNEALEEVSRVAAPHPTDDAAFIHTVGGPGGMGGFGGPPDGTAFWSLAHPYEIRNLHFTQPDPNAGPRVIALELHSNVSLNPLYQVIPVTVTELFARANIWVDATDSLALTIPVPPGNSAGVQDMMEVNIASMAYGDRRYMRLIETTPVSQVFSSERVILVTHYISPQTRDMQLITAAGAGPVVVLTQNPADPAEFRNDALQHSMRILRSTGINAGSRDDLTVAVETPLVKEILDALETEVASLEFRTDVIFNNRGPGAGPGALNGLKPGSGYWEPRLYSLGPILVAPGCPPPGCLWRQRGADNVFPPGVFQWKLVGAFQDFLTYSLHQGHRPVRVRLVAPDDPDRNPAWREDGGYFYVEGVHGDFLIAQGVDQRRRTYSDKVALIPAEPAGNGTTVIAPRVFQANWKALHLPLQSTIAVRITSANNEASVTFSAPRNSALAPGLSWIPASEPFAIGAPAAYGPFAQWLRNPDGSITLQGGRGLRAGETTTVYLPVRLAAAANGANGTGDGAVTFTVSFP